MKLVTIGLVQTKVSNNIDVNVGKTVKLIEQAAKKGAQIVCLQELFQTIYFPQAQGLNKSDFAETVPGPTSTVMKNLAKKLGIVLIVPIYEKAKNGKFYNTAVVFDQNGESLGQYRKVHIPQDPGFYEKDYFEASDSGYKIFKTKFGNFAVLICYDQWFPEAARLAKIAGAEIIFYPTAIADILGYVPPEGDWHNAWETVMRGHAIANSIIVAAPNRLGKENKSSFWGQSFICDSFGKIIKRGSKNKEESIVAKFDLDMNKFISEGWGFMRNRRPETYKLLSKK